MHVVVHNDEAIDNHSLIFYKELHATGDNVFIFIWFKNRLPFKVVVAVKNCGYPVMKEGMV
jgi:hypothetical protein